MRTAATRTDGIKSFAAMADTEGEVSIEDETAIDEEMGENVETVVDESAPAGLEDIEPTLPNRTTFLE